MFFVYSPDGTVVYGSRDGELEGMGQVTGVGVKSCKIVFLG